MAKKAKQTWPDSDETILWTNGTGSAVAVGDKVRVNGRLHVAHVAIADGDSGTLLAKGGFEFAKGTGYTCAVGDVLTWDGTKMVVKVGTAHTPGDALCTKAAVTGDTVVEATLISQPFPFGLPLAKAASAGDDTNNYIEITHNLGANPSVVIPLIKNTSNVYRVPAGAVTFPTVNTVRVADANLAVNEVLHVFIAP
jgi:predicted RecA/RadA family phage recombinase